MGTLILKVRKVYHINMVATVIGSVDPIEESLNQFHLCPFILELLTNQTSRDKTGAMRQTSESDSEDFSSTRLSNLLEWERLALKPGCHFKS